MSEDKQIESTEKEELALATPASQPATSNKKQAPEDMETHAHHLHKAPSHGWKHYLFEFLMLFLAVFSGFVAENIREHEVDRRREREFIGSLVADLRDDIKNVDGTIHSHQQGIALLDSLFTLLNDSRLIRTNGAEIYYAARRGPRVATLVNNSRTFDQLKNSGGFLLIHDVQVSNRIMDYYALFPMLRLLENTSLGEFENYKSNAAKIFDPVVFRRQENASGIIMKGNDNPPLRSYDRELIEQLGIYVVYLNGSRRSLIQRLEVIKSNAQGLINYLQKYYSIK